MDRINIDKEIQRLCLEKGKNTEFIIEHMAMWKKKEPWFYADWVFNKYTYYLLMTVVLCLVSSSLIMYPIISNGFAAAIGYFLAQFIFQFGHMTTHAHYIESEKEVWEPGVLVAYLHHYSTPKEIYKNWLVHRLNFIMQTRGCAVAYGFAWVLPFYLFGASTLLPYFWFLFWFSMIEPVHEWYHVPKNKRKKHFSAPMYYGLCLFNFIGILNEKDHIKHHWHTVKNLEDVTKFSDLYTPGSDSFFDRLWSVALYIRDKKIFKHTPLRKTIYAQGTVLIPLVFCMSSYFFYYFTELI